MRANIKDIIKVAGVSETDAARIEDRMGENGIDFSECTSREFKREALDAADELGICVY